MIQFTAKHPQVTAELLGIMPFFFSEDDPRPARDQLDENYQHGGGYRPLHGWEMRPDGTIKYPGDDRPPRLLAEAKLRDETLRFFESAWLCIIQPDGSFAVTRVD